MGEWKITEEEKPKIGDQVIIYSKYGFHNKTGNYQIVIYTNDHGLPLMFHSLDFMNGYEPTEWYPLSKPKSQAQNQVSAIWER